MTPLPFSTVIVVSAGAGAFGFAFAFRVSPSATAVAFSGDSTSGCENSCTARWMFSRDVVSSA